MNWNEVLIHASSVSKLFTEPKSKEDKIAGNLSATAKAHCIDIYNEKKYGRKKHIETKGMRKGTKVEPESIMLLSEWIGDFLEKNEETLSNDFITGTPDVRWVNPNTGKKVIFEIKSSETIHTFMPKILDGVDEHFEQVNSYMWLDNADEGYLVYCLTNNSQDEINKEKGYLMNKLACISEESPEFIAAWEEKRLLLEYDDISESERILIFPIEKDPDFPVKCQQKVEKARQFLLEFENRHLNFNK